VRSAKESLRIRLRTGQGVGDELFFLRFAPLLRKRGHRLTLLTGSKLAALLAPMADVFDAIEDVDAVGKPTPCDVELLCSDLPLATDVLPPPSLEFQPEEARVSRLAKRLETFGGPPYIGVTWRGGVLPDEQLQAKLHWVYSKQVPLAELANVLRPLKATIVVLQRRVTNDELQTFGTFLGREAADLSAVHDDLRDSLALLSLLDEYIGVSNTNMHLLAGLQDKRGRVLVQTPAEWRWGVDGDTSVWFPGFRLYRQTPDKKWNAALRSLAEELRPYGASEPGLGIRRA
jgi:hypothetical protein